MAGDLTLVDGSATSSLTPMNKAHVLWHELRRVQASHEIVARLFAGTGA